MRNVAAVCCHVAPDRTAFNKVPCCNRYVAVVRVRQIGRVRWIRPVVWSGIWSRDVVVYYFGTTRIRISWVFGIVTVDEPGGARAVKRIYDPQRTAKNIILRNRNQFDAPGNLRICDRRQTKVIPVSVAITSLEMIELKIDLAQEGVTHSAAGGVRHEIGAARKKLIRQTDAG